MTEPNKEARQYLDINTIFAAERQACQPDKARINRIMHSIHHERSMQDLGIMLFVRFWVSLLQLGAVIYVASTENKQKRTHYYKKQQGLR